MIHFLIYNQIVRLFKSFAPDVSTSRFLGSVFMVVIEGFVIYKVDILFIRIIEAVFLVLALINGIRHCFYMLKRRKIKKSWLKYHSDLNGLDQLIYTKRMLNDMIYNISDGKDGQRISEREKSISEVYPQIETAISEANSSYKNNEISVQTMLEICRNTINSINKAFDSNQFEPEYLDVIIPSEIRSFVINHSEQVQTHSKE